MIRRNKHIRTLRSDENSNYSIGNCAAYPERVDGMCQQCLCDVVITLSRDRVHHLLFNSTLKFTRMSCRRKAKPVSINAMHKSMGTTYSPSEATHSSTIMNEVHPTLQSHLFPSSQLLHRVPKCLRRSLIIWHIRTFAPLREHRPIKVFREHLTVNVRHRPHRSDDAAESRILHRRGKV